jgi:hypothetical protein
MQDELARLKRVENPITYGLATAAAALYVWWRLQGHVIAVYTWMIPFGVVVLVGKFAFTVVEMRIRRAFAAPEREVATARVVGNAPATRAPAAAAPAVTTPTPPGDEPSILS